MKAYGHLTYKDKEHIALLRVEGLCPSQIAQEIGRPPYTVGRELKRNSNGDGGYRPMSADISVVVKTDLITDKYVKRYEKKWRGNQIS